jgi:ribosomal protein S18 acetylase RimI-like enzyme
LALEKEVHDLLYIERLTHEKDIPFRLLLLADETVDVIAKYVYWSEVYLAKHVASNLLIAVFVLQELNPKEIEIKNIAVDAAYQGRGIGSFLIGKIKQIALGQGMQILWVGTPDSATRQLNFYQRNGFRKAGVRINFFLENYPEPIYENGILLRDMIMLQLFLTRQTDATKTELNNARR